MKHESLLLGPYVHILNYNDYYLKYCLKELMKIYMFSYFRREMQNSSMDVLVKKTNACMVQ